MKFYAIRGQNFAEFKQLRYNDVTDTMRAEVTDSEGNMPFKVGDVVTIKEFSEHAYDVEPTKSYFGHQGDTSVRTVWEYKGCDYQNDSSRSSMRRISTGKNIGTRYPARYDNMISAKYEGEQNDWENPYFIIDHPDVRVLTNGVDYISQFVDEIRYIEGGYPTWVEVIMRGKQYRYGLANIGSLVDLNYRSESNRKQPLETIENDIRDAYLREIEPELMSLIEERMRTIRDEYLEQLEPEIEANVKERMDAIIKERSIGVWYNANIKHNKFKKDKTVIAWDESGQRFAPRGST